MKTHYYKLVSVKSLAVALTLFLSLIFSTKSAFSQSGLGETWVTNDYFLGSTMDDWHWEDMDLGFGAKQFKWKVASSPTTTVHAIDQWNPLGWGGEMYNVNVTIDSTHPLHYLQSVNTYGYGILQEGHNVVGVNCTEMLWDVSNGRWNNTYYSKNH